MLGFILTPLYDQLPGFVYAESGYSFQCLVLLCLLPFDIPESFGHLGLSTVQVQLPLLLGLDLAFQLLLPLRVPSFYAGEFLALFLDFRLCRAS